ncbi:replication-relaxation family protein [Micromonospora sp. SL1-18]|uniref:replication-relaxation family protein n=1 Tax=Micromonospora sp. SL1-18 TaxID=3399128 RepID=UPI003A4DCFE5
MWSAADARVGFFLEADTGPEPLGRVVTKLDRYAQLIRRSGPRYPVLFWLGSEHREEHLHRLLPGQHGDVPVATAIHTSEPAEAVWLPAGANGRVPLAELHHADPRVPVVQSSALGDRVARDQSLCR